jgi:hypothetical protein
LGRGRNHPPPHWDRSDDAAIPGLGGPSGLWFILLFAASFGLSFITTLSRAKLWLGPQTAILGGVGICFAVAIAMLAWHWVHTPQAAQLDQPRLGRRGLIAVMGGCVVVGALILRVGFAAFPNSADEYGFLFTAHTLAQFRLWLPAPADPHLFGQQFLLAHGGRWVSQYLPGWPAVIAVFELLHLPSWLAAPACAALLAWVLWRALRLECASPPLTALLLLLCVTSGFFLLNAGTFYSHCVSALAVLGTVLCMLMAERRSHWIWPVAAGACVGFALLCRLDSGVLAGIGAFAAWIEQGMKRRTLLLGTAGFLPMLLLFGAYDWAITGVPFEPPTMWAGNFRIGLHGVAGTDPAAGRFRAIVQTLWRLGELADTASLLLPALYVSALAWRLRARRLRFYDILPAANFVLFLIYPDLGGFQMGPRYWFDGFVIMHLTVGSVFGAQDIAWRRFAVACCALLIPVSLARLPMQVQFHAREMHERASMFRLGAALPKDERAVILVDDFPSAWNDRANRTDWNLAKDFARNMPPLNARVLYARGDLTDAASRACGAFPDRHVLRFNLDRAHPDGWLVPVPCTG